MFKARKPSVKREKKYSCDHCSKKFAYHAYLRRHTSAIHNITLAKECITYTCEICKCWFRTKLSYSKHQIKQHQVKQPKCDFCETKFFTEKQLAYHQRHTCRHETCVWCNFHDYIFYEMKEADPESLSFSFETAIANDVPIKFYDVEKCSS